MIKRCTMGVLDDLKTQWRSCPKTLAGRLANWGFDFATMKAIPGWYESRSEGGRISGRPRTDATKVPKELKTDGKVDPVASSSLVNFDEAAEVNKIFKRMRKDFPDISAESDLKSLELLAKLYVTADRIAKQALTGGKITKSQLDSFSVENIARIQKLLGIDRPSREKAKGETGEGSVADLVVEFERYVNSGEFAQKEREFFVEEVALLLRKYDRETPDGMREIDDVLFERFTGLTVEQAKKLISNPWSASSEELYQSVVNGALERSETQRDQDEEMRRNMIKTNAQNRRRARKRLLAEGRSREDVNRIVPQRKYGGQS